MTACPLRRFPACAGESLPQRGAVSAVTTAGASVTVSRWRSSPMPDRDRPTVTLTADDIDALYRSHARAMVTFFSRRTLDAEAAVDLVAETFAVAIAGRASCRARRPATERAAWLFGIARNQLHGWYRRGAIERRALERVGIERPALVDADVERIDELAGLQRAARAGRGAARAACRPTHGRRCGCASSRSARTARWRDALGVSEQTVRARVSRGLRSLASSLGRVEAGTGPRPTRKDGAVGRALCLTATSAICRSSSGSARASRRRRSARRRQATARGGRGCAAAAAAGVRAAGRRSGRRAPPAVAGAGPRGAARPLGDARRRRPRRCSSCAAPSSPPRARRRPSRRRPRAPAASPASPSPTRAATRHAGRCAWPRAARACCARRSASSSAASSGSSASTGAFAASRRRPPTRAASCARTRRRSSARGSSTPRGRPDVRTVVSGVAGTRLRGVTVAAAGRTQRVAVHAGGTFLAVFAGPARGPRARRAAALRRRARRAPPVRDRPDRPARPGRRACVAHRERRALGRLRRPASRCALRASGSTRRPARARAARSATAPPARRVLRHPPPDAGHEGRPSARRSAAHGARRRRGCSSGARRARTSPRSPCAGRGASAGPGRSSGPTAAFAYMFGPRVRPDQVTVTVRFRDGRTLVRDALDRPRPHTRLPQERPMMRHVRRLVACGLVAGVCAGVIAAVAIPQTTTTPAPPHAAARTERAAGGGRRAARRRGARRPARRRASCAFAPSVRSASRRPCPIPRGGPRWAVRQFLAERLAPDRPDGSACGAVIGRNRCVQLGRIARRALRLADVRRDVSPGRRRLRSGRRRSACRAGPISAVTRGGRSSRRSPTRAARPPSRCRRSSSPWRERRRATRG